jgi:hypothetical protein
MRQSYLSNRVFRDYDDVVEASSSAWNELVAEQGRIASIGDAGQQSVKVREGWYKTSTMRRLSIAVATRSRGSDTFGQMITCDPAGSSRKPGPPRRMKEIAPAAARLMQAPRAIFGPSAWKPDGASFSDLKGKAAFVV